MPECRLLSYAVLDGPPFYVNGPMRSVCRCETHNFDVPNPVAEMLCPIGRIEKATDEALDKIRKANTDRTMTDAESQRALPSPELNKTTPTQ